jgi:AraC family transcriptional regulator, exoenzyme S synthesis regulatory protein ExsA
VAAAAPLSMLRILPQKFYDDPSIHKILVDGHACIVHKVIEQTVLGKEGFLSTHAINFVLNGTLRVENEDGLYTEVTAGNMIFMPKGIYTVSDILPQNGHFEAMMFFFDHSLVSQFLSSLNFQGSKEKCITHAVIRATDDLHYFAATLLRLYGGTTGNRQLTQMKLFELLHLIHHAYPDTKQLPSILANLDNKERRSLREFMQANFHKPLGIADYAYLTGRSVSTFTRDFKTKFEGVAPKQWLIERRLEKAHQLLAQHTLRNISEVAWESGYEDVPHFIKAFHRQYGITPKQFVIQQRVTSRV